MNELTPWFPPEIKPIYRGTYEVMVLGCPDFYAWWTGCEWLAPYMQKHQPEERRNNSPLARNQHLQWRGLARPIE